MRHTNSRRSKSNRSNGKRPYNNGQNRSFESNSASTKLRGTASQVFEKYVALARDASSSGDRVSAENFFQHAEHYFRIQNLMSPEKISLKLKTFAHTEYSKKEFSSVDVIMDKINKKVDLFNRGHNYQRRILDNTFPEYLIKNIHLYKEWIV